MRGIHLKRRHTIEIQRRLTLNDNSIITTVQLKNYAPHVFGAAFALLFLTYDGEFKTTEGVHIKSIALMQVKLIQN